MKLIKIHWFLLLICIFNTYHSRAQDSIRYINAASFLKMIMQYHPVASQASLLKEAAKNELLSARGNFDPYVKSIFSQKDLDDNNYWKTWESALIIPVLPGADIKAGFDRNEGKYLDPERQTSADGLSYLGISVPLGQGFFIDERRKILFQAKLLPQIAEAERVKLINKLLMQASKDFFDWGYAWRKYALYNEAVKLSEVRFMATRDRVIHGDLPAIDSVEALLELENRRILQKQSEMDYKNLQFVVSNYLWNDKMEPLQVSNNLLPLTDTLAVKLLDEDTLKSFISVTRSAHPELLKTDLKIRQYEIDKKYSAEKLKPKINIDYNFLSSNNGGYFNEYNFGKIDNYKFGLNFNMPLFLREERGRLNQYRIKIMNTQLERIQTERELVNQVNQAFNELNNFNEQVQIQRSQIRYATTLLESENFRFLNGEGSLFLVNSREQILINSKIRLAELESKYFKSRTSLDYSAGILINTVK